MYNFRASELVIIVGGVIVAGCFATGCFFGVHGGAAGCVA